MKLTAVRSGILPFASGAALVLALSQLLQPGLTALGQDNRAPKENPPGAAEKLEELLPQERDVVQVFQKVSPAVVNVSNLAQRRGYFSLSVQEIPQGTGTGFVWDKKGHIVTNFHVIAGADAVSVNFADQSMKRATVVGTYPDKDLAVLKIDASSDSLVPVVPGASHNLLVGQTVLAIGNPFGLDHTLTTGVVSALGREIKSLNNRTISDVIQTDASINPGNSGGPLLDSHGRLIGVNTAIFSPSGTNAGIGFAIPVDVLRPIISQIIEKGKVERAGMGVELFPDNFSNRLHAEGVLQSEGVVIYQVVPGSAAAKAGLQGTVWDGQGDIVLGDVITGVDGKKVSDMDDLLTVLEKHKVGDTVDLTYQRGRKEKTTKVTLQSVGQ